MAIYNIQGIQLTACYNISGSELSNACDINSAVIFIKSTSIEEDDGITATQVNIAGGNSSNQMINKNSVASNVDLSQLKMTVSGDADCIQTNGGYYMSQWSMFVITIKGIKMGTAVLTVKSGDTVVKKYRVTVTSDSTEYADYKTWRVNLQGQLWTTSMSDKQKLDAVKSHIVNNFTYDSQSTYAVEIYKTSKANCFGAAELMADFAKDLGLNTMWQDRDSGKTYTNMSEATANFNGHVHTLVDISGTWYKYDATPQYGDGNAGGVAVTL